MRVRGSDPTPSPALLPSPWSSMAPYLRRVKTSRKTWCSLTHQFLTRDNQSQNEHRELEKPHAGLTPQTVQEAVGQACPVAR